MNSRAMSLTQLYHDLALLPEDKLQEAREFIESMQHTSASQSRQIVQMQGIWVGKGFEQIDSLEDELRVIRAEVEHIIRQKAG
jgi:hypothetical protein